MMLFAMGAEDTRCPRDGYADTLSVFTPIL